MRTKKNIRHICKENNLFRQSENNSEAECLKNINFLGGISLYNQNYQRHLSKRQNESRKYIKESTHIKSAKAEQKIEAKLNMTALEEYHKDYLEKNLIEKTIQNKNEQKQFKEHHISDEIVSIIQQLRGSQATTIQFLSDFKKQKVDDFQDVQQTLQYIINNYTTHNQQNLQQNLSRYLRLLKFRILQELQRLKDEQERRINQKYEEKKASMVECTTQTLPDKAQKQIVALKKQLKIKDVEYNTLYAFKKDKLEKKEQFQRQQLSKMVSKLEEQNKSKTDEIKALKYQFNTIQSKYFHKILQDKSEKQSSPFSQIMKDHLENIEEYEDEDNFEKETLQTFQLFKTNLMKNRNKQNADSRFSLFTSKVEKRISAATAKMMDKSYSLTNIKEKEVDDDSQYSWDEAQTQKNSLQVKNILSAMENYLTKNVIKKKQSKLKLKNSKSFQSFESAHSEKSSKKKSFKFIVKPQNKNKPSDHKKSPLGQPQSKPQYQETSIFGKISKGQSGLNSGSNINISNLMKVEDSIQTSFKQSSGILQNESISRKVKKRVSFLLSKYKKYVKMNEINSREVDFCFVPPPENESRNRQMNDNEVSASFLAINQTLNKYQKGDKMKLVKTSSMKQKGHFKTKSSLIQPNRNDNQHNFRKTYQNQSSLRNSTTATPVSKERFSAKPNYRAIKTRENSPKNILEEKQDCQSVELLTETKIKSIAARCKNKAQFRFQIKQKHGNCGEHCNHIQQYFKVFQKVKAKGIRETIKLNQQVLNKHLSSEQQPFLPSTQRNIQNDRKLNSTQNYF